MAAGSIPKPGTQYGPCAGSCEHRDCAAMWRVMDSICHHCGSRIGYDKNFYDVGDGAHVHAVCEETAIENEQKGATS